jgi:hypothetical protein
MLISPGEPKIFAEMLHSPGLTPTPLAVIFACHDCRSALHGRIDSAALGAAAECQGDQGELYNCPRVYLVIEHRYVAA